MSNVFTSIPEDKNNLHVNTYDWTHYYNMSAQIGEIKPCFCQKVPPHTGFSVSPRFAFQMMPMVFPIQTPIKARISFYKMPIRALWKNYQDWISSVNTQTHSRYDAPFVSFSNDWSENEFTQVFGTKSLADYFNIPSTYDGYSTNSVVEARPSTNFVITSNYLPDAHSVVNITGAFSTHSTSPVVFGRTYDITRTFSSDTLSGYDFILGATNLSEVDLSGAVLRLYECTFSGNTINVGKFVDVEIDSARFDGTIIVNCTRTLGEPITFYQGDYMLAVLRCSVSTDSQSSQFDYFYSDLLALTYHRYTKSNCPWYNLSTGRGKKISGYPWRMYDAVYNTFIRNIRNNPLYDKDDLSLPLYNKVTQLYDLPDGISDFSYGSQNAAWPTKQQMLEYASTRFANWEYDMFTTAVQTPMEGVAPLVGLTTYATNTQLEDGTQKLSLTQYVTDEDGKRYQVDTVTDEDGIQSATFTEVQAPQGVRISNLYQAISEGISIADLRNVNAFTRYLELNQRRGYRYKDIVEGRYDVKVRFDELLMPEFIGGFTREVRINPVTQTVQTTDQGTYDGSLGSKSGDGFVYGESNNRISCYCDESSIIMAIISFTPTPVYIQNLPKWLLDRDILDEWSPEFNNLGFQPLYNWEVAPIQYYNNEASHLDDVFGYQRPWYHLLSQVDTAHGDFRGPLRNFLMHRVFDGAPKLTKAFLQVHPDQVNDVFAVTENTDKIFGQVGFDCTVKLGVSRDAVPRLE